MFLVNLFYFLPFLFLIFFFSKFFSNSTPKKLPPSPPRVPILGNLHQLGTFPHRSLHSLAQKYGQLMLLRLGNVPVLVVSSALAAREIMKTQDMIFASRPKYDIAEKLLYGSKDLGFSPYGEHWRQLKRICVVHLLSNNRVQSYRTVREEETSLMIDKIRSSSCLNLCSSSVNLSELFLSLANNIVCRVALGKKYDGEDRGKRYKELLRRFLDLMGTFNMGAFIPSLAWVNGINGWDAKTGKVAKEMDEFLEEVVQEHVDRYKRPNGDSGSVEIEGSRDFVDILLEIQREKISSCSPIDGDAIKALIWDILGGGTDTTFSTLEWTMAELIRHPQIMKKLQNEVREIARGEQNVTEDDIDKMHYLKSVIKESLRIHPPVPLLFPRESIKDANVMGYDIAAGTQVFINAWAISRDPSSWEDPEEFRPERFLNSSVDLRGHDFGSIPFGAGRRGCPGTLFATSIIELALANVVHKFNFSSPGGAKVFKEYLYWERSRHLIWDSICSITAYYHLLACFHHSRP